MTEQKSLAEVAAEGSSDDTRSSVRRVKRATRNKYTLEEKARIFEDYQVMVTFVGASPPYPWTL